MAKIMTEEQMRRSIRQARTQAQTKCPCGNCASSGEVKCGRCLEIDSQARRAADVVAEAVQSLSNALYEAGVNEYHDITEKLCNLIDAKLNEIR